MEDAHWNTEAKEPNRRGTASGRDLQALTNRLMSQPLDNPWKQGNATSNVVGNRSRAFRHCGDCICEA